MNEMSLLIVDDNKKTLNYLKELLKNFFHEIFLAENANEALEIYKLHKPEILLIDIYLPGKDGFELSQEVRKINKHQIIIIMSIYLNKQNLLKAMNLGINYCISKPIDIEELMFYIESSVNKIHDFENEYYKDFLTGVYNRKYLNRKIKEFKDKNFTLLFLDLDKFKPINDTYGHKVGDNVLKVFANILKNNVRKDEDFVFRLGGDEFIIILNTIDDEIIEKVIEKIKKRLSENIIIGNISLYLEFSIGYIKYPIECNNIDELIKIADKRMYINKKSAR